MVLLDTLTKYNAYANQKLLEAASSFSLEELESAPNLSHTSGFKLIRHLVVVEAHYLAQCQGRTPQHDPDSLSSLDSLTEFYSRISDDIQAFTASLNDEDAARVIDVSIGGHTFRFPVWQLLLQMFLHSAHHRGELAVLLTSLGKPPGIDDIIVHFAELSGQRWPWKQ